jgi:hypothetical protein
MGHIKPLYMASSLFKLNEYTYCERSSIPKNYLTFLDAFFTGVCKAYKGDCPVFFFVSHDTY